MSNNALSEIDYQQISGYIKMLLLVSDNRPTTYSNHYDSIMNDLLNELQTLLFSYTDKLDEQNKLIKFWRNK